MLSLLMIHSVQAMELKGRFTQGGFAFGQVPEGTRVTLDGTAVAVAPSGWFGVGFGRNHPVEANLTFIRGDARTTKTLIIEPREFPVQHIKGVPQKTVTPNKTQNTRAAEDRKGILAARKVMSQVDYFKNTFITPTDGVETGVFGSRRTYNGVERSWHKGLDIAAPTGTPILAPVAGTITFAADTFYNGNLVMIDHGLQWSSVYAHMDKISVRVGDFVSAGDVIGTVGNTGRSTGPHLHWGFYWKNIALDPRLLLDTT